VSDNGNEAFSIVVLTAVCCWPALFFLPIAMWIVLARRNSRLQIADAELKAQLRVTEKKLKEAQNEVERLTKQTGKNPATKNPKDYLLMKQIVGEISKVLIVHDREGKKYPYKTVESLRKSLDELASAKAS